MNKKTRDEMRELAEKAKEVYLSHEVHEGGLLIWESNDWSYILSMGDFNDNGEMGKHIASCSPDRILELLDYVDECNDLMKDLLQFSTAHHGDQDKHKLLHSLTIDIPYTIRKFLDGSERGS